MSKKHRLQDAHTSKILNYGHLGPLHYNQTTEEWETSRIIRPDDSSLEASSYTTAHSAFPFRHVSSRLLLTGDLAGQARAQLDSVGPDQVPERQLALLSHGSRSSPEELLAIGGAVIGDDPSIRESYQVNPSITTIGAAVDVSTHGVVRMFTLDALAQSSGTDGDDSSNDSLSGHKQYKTKWTSSGGPIQQIYFGPGAGYSSTWVAVRLLTSTIIFHPLIGRKLHANPFVSIPISRTGGFSHADVAIIYRANVKIALVDSRGNWTIWQIEGADNDRLNVKGVVSLVSHGRLAAAKSQEPSTSASLDAWHQIRWFTESEDWAESLFVCSRYNASFFESSGTRKWLVDLRLGRPEHGRAILDVRNSKTRPDLVFVLTSVCLLVVSLKASTETRDVHQGHDPILLVWRHFRSQRDTTLRLNLIESGLGKYVTQSSLLLTS